MSAGFGRLLGRVRPEPDEGVAPGDLSQWTGGPALATKACTVLLWSSLVCAPVGLALGGASLALASGRPAAAAGVVVDDDAAGQRVAAEEFAGRVVLTWLTTPRGQEQRLSSLLRVASSWTAPEKPFSASNLAPASVQHVGSVWAVTVGVDVSDDAGETARRYFLVPVVAQAGQVAALALPAPVAGPPVGIGVSLNYQWPIAGDGPVASTVAQFLKAYLTGGTDDVTRYVSPGAPQPITAIAPAPYRDVKVNDISGDSQTTTAVPADGEQLRVLVDVSASVTSQQDVEATYALTLQARTGRWEVLSIDPAPAFQLSPGEPATAGAASSTAPSPAAPSTSVSTEAPSSTNTSTSPTSMVHG